MEQENGMASEAEMIWYELEIGQRLEILERVIPNKSMARTMNRVFKYIEKNITKYQHLLGH